MLADVAIYTLFVHRILIAEIKVVVRSISGLPLHLNIEFCHIPKRMVGGVCGWRSGLQLYPEQFQCSFISYI